MKIETLDWSHTCGDGCCYSNGTTLYLDGSVVEGRIFSNSEEAFQYVLEEVLGHVVKDLPSQHED